MSRCTSLLVLSHCLWTCRNPCTRFIPAQHKCVQYLPLHGLLQSLHFISTPFFPVAIVQLDVCLPTLDSIKEEVDYYWQVYVIYIPNLQDKSLHSDHLIMVGVFNLHREPPVNAPIIGTVHFVVIILANDANGICSDTKILSSLPRIEQGASSIRGKYTNHWATIGKCTCFRCYRPQVRSLAGW